MAQVKQQLAVMETEMPPPAEAALTPLRSSA
jgi:hypothetical protein